MAAVELPLNDAYLSSLHETRNARKAAERLARSQSTLFQVQEQDNDDEAEESRMTSPSKGTGASSGGGMSSSASAPAVSLASAAGIAATSDADAGSLTTQLSVSDASLLSQVPTPLLRLLVLLSPLITATAHFVRLATWTAGPGTASHSFLLVLTWWGVCLYGYEVLRYAPQALILAYIGFTGLRKAVRESGSGAAAASAAAASKRTRPVTSQALNLVLADLAELADFTSSLSTHALAPLVALLSWRTGNSSNTRRLAVFLLATWPVWLLCFSPGLWDATGLPRLGLALGQRFSLAGKGLATRAWPHLCEAFYKFETKLAYKVNFQQAHTLLQAKQHFYRFFALYRQHVQPVFRIIGRTLHVPLLSPRPAAHALGVLPILPPWPLFALTLRHALLVLGTLALTWCAPWAALIRHALWRSATVRRATLASVRILSGTPKSAFGKGHIGSFTSSHAENELQVPSFFAQPPSVGAAPVGKAKSALTKKDDGDVTRHEDVEYQFTIFENQRWWVGLDWTAALLPQERPAWSDDANNPVSPPSSFSLPPARITLKPAPTRANPKAYTRRLVKWQWLDPEWSVAGRDTFSVAAEESSAKSGYLGDAIGRLRGARRVSVSASGAPASPSAGGGAGAGGEEVPASPSSARRTSQSASDLPSDISVLDVDADGWQYGDNAWDKMSRKGGLGRYTRRRRWIRTAVLVELVERNYTPSQGEIEEAAKSGGALEGAPKEGTEGSAAAGAVATTAAQSASSPADRSDLRQRLAKAAGGPASPTSPDRS